MPSSEDEVDLFGSDDEVDDQRKLDEDSAEPSALDVAAAAASRDVEEPVEDEDEDDDITRGMRVRAQGAPVSFVQRRLPKLPHQAELWMVKLPASIAFECKPFNADSFLEERESGEQQVDEDVDPSCKVRWRNTVDTDGNRIRDSNARYVTWSDGSTQLLLGSQVFDMSHEKVDASHHHLYALDGSVNFYQGGFSTKALLRPVSVATNRSIHFRLNRIKKESVRRTAVRTYEKTDPEMDMARRAKEQRREEIRRRKKDKAELAALPTIEFNAAFLEMGATNRYSEDDSEDEYEPQIRSRRRYEVEDEDGAHSRLQSIKKGAAVVRGQAQVRRREDAASSDQNTQKKKRRAVLDSDSDD